MFTCLCGVWNFDNLYCNREIKLSRGPKINFLGGSPRFNLLLGNALVLKTRLITKVEVYRIYNIFMMTATVVSQNELSYCSLMYSCTALVEIHHAISQQIARQN